MEPNYLVNIKLQVEESVLPKKEKKGRKRVTLEGKIRAPYLRLLITLPPFLNLKLAFSRVSSQ